MGVAMVVALLMRRVVAVLAVLVVMPIVQEIRVNIQLGVEIEAAQVKHLRQRHIPKVHRLLRRTGVHVLEAVLQGVEFLRRHEVGLADEDLVRKPHLAARFLAVVELLRRVLGIHQGEDGVEQEAFSNFVVHEEGLGHGARVSQTGGFNHHTLKVQFALAALLGQITQGGAQVFADGAAHAAVAHLDDLLVGVRHQDVVVDVFLAKLVLDDRNLLAVGLGEHALEQGGFSGTQKTGEDGGRNQHRKTVSSRPGGANRGIWQCSRQFKPVQEGLAPWLVCVR